MFLNAIKWLRTLWSKSTLIFNSVGVCWRPHFGDWKPVPLHRQVDQPRSPLLSQDFAIRKVPSGSSSESPTSPTQEFLQASLIGDCALAIRKALKTPSARRARCLLGCPFHMFPQLIFRRSGKQNKSWSSSPMGLSSRCLPTELVTMRNISSTSLRLASGQAKGNSCWGQGSLHSLSCS